MVGYATYSAVFSILERVLLICATLYLVFNKCSGILENGKRLENLSWRVFAHETLCINSPKRRKRASPLFDQHHDNIRLQDTPNMPPLSSSVESGSSVEFEDVDDEDLNLTSNGCYRNSFGEHSSMVDQVRIRGDKHITPLDLENLVISIKAKQDLSRPLSPLPLPEPSLDNSSAVDQDQDSGRGEEGSVDESGDTTITETASCASTFSQDISETPRPSSPRNVESSTSTIGSDANSPYLASPSNASETSADSDLSHSVVRGFREGNRGVSTYRSQSHLHLAPPPQSVPRQSEPRDTTLPRKKGGFFQLGGSLTEDEASLRDHLSPDSQGSMRVGSSRPNAARKHTSFLEKVTEIPKKTFMLSSSQEDGNAIESDDDDFDDEEEEISESAIEDDDEEWEDEEVVPVDESTKLLSFARVDSKPNLVSRRSIITQGLHEGQRAMALQNAASRSSPHMRRSRTSTPNGPSMPASPEDLAPVEIMASPAAASRPIMLPTENVIAPAVLPPLSPRATRRNMLTSELGVSLRKHMLNERQQRTVPYPTSTAVPRRHTSHNLQALTQYPEPATSAGRSGKDVGSSRNNSWTDYFDYGMGEYHQKGW